MSFDTSPNVFSARDVFKRCVKCESAAPSCPACDEGYTCTMISQSCDQCATTKCIRTSSSSSSSSGNSGSSGGSNAGAIAGGVIGGLAFVTIVVGLVWWFYMRKKKNSNEYSLGGTSTQEKRGANAQGSRKSTGSIASTVLTRASNVIQIAYIPGVTNRSPPDTPSLVPPVPPLPGAAPDQHFFMPGDLRDSSFTEMSNDRRSGAPSVSPSLRSSVATTIYRNNAIVSPMPAQQAMLTRAAVVSIHGNQPTQTAAITPPDAPAVPAITPAQLAKAGVTDANNSGNNNNNNNSSIVARPVMAKPVMVKTVGGKKNNNATPAVQTIEEQSEASSSTPVSRSASTKEQADPAASGFDDSSDEEDEPSGKTAKAKSTEKPPTVTEASEEQGPFTDRASTHLETNDGPGSNRSSRTPPARVESPFSDANEVQ
ncbi:hypothetical protein SI65_09770 [Aspergillus cristatus]|uniref:Membrane anchor Opy2 N-terminal domain-containing protein n=1 Tax=Aspergillus cristatus TaxID=573508 RepID=A0A1E3B2V9_ASPCR|nr:hypothetical protein SI65_09770 [Aspergillus cristatus]